ncbi:hypothetical protein [Colwellia sp. RSH04]|uniref:hypothetical protein n=1 Tax=Colwellia sp. RSH04 TaxID=2305464 RepID=UPI000E590E9D|nr:hypothetical protein [Colwellia sp. RSH04]RHW77716.1 hypothetical protein D1094_01900 [Colwellia sp. RSH04]
MSFTKTRNKLQRFFWVLILSTTWLCHASSTVNSSAGLSDDETAPWGGVDPANRNQNLINRMKIDEGYSAETTDLIGERINNLTGALSFSHTDVSIKGNSNLPISIIRNFSTGLGSKSAINNASLSITIDGSLSNGGFALGGWNLEIPRVETLALSDYGWHEARCSDAFYTPNNNINIAIGQYGIEPSQYWQGISFFDAQASMRRLLDPTPWVPGSKLADIAPNAELVSNAFDVVTCIPSANTSGEGFLVKTAQGITYQLDHIRKQNYSPVPFGVKFNAKRDKYSALVTKISDNFGNWVKYQYDTQDRLIRIYANDERNLWLHYRSDYSQLLSNVESSFTGEGTRKEEVRYHYQFLKTYPDNEEAPITRAVLNQVDIGEGLSWQFDLNSLAWYSATSNHTTDNPCDPSAIESGISTGSITHPYGAIATYELEAIESATKNLPNDLNNKVAPECSFFDLHERSFLPAIKMKSLSGVGTNYQWNYSYSGYTYGNSGAIGERATIVTQDENNGRNKTTKYTYDVDYNNITNGSLIKTEIFSGSSTSPSALLQTSTTAYEQGPLILGNPNGNGPGFSYHYASESYLVRPNAQIVSIDGNTYTKNTLAFDNYGNALTVESFESEVNKRIENFGYQHDLVKWQLSLPTTKKLNGLEVSKTEYNGKNKAEKLYQYGSKQVTLTYHSDGTLASQTDALSNTFTYDNYKLGTPQLITLPNATTVQYSINHDGTVAWEKNENGFKTLYQWDDLKRIKKKTLPKDSANVWPDINYSYSFALGGEATGVIAGQPVRTITQGSKQSVSYYDAFKRPLLTLQQDITTGRKIFNSVRYNLAGATVFSGYPSYTVNTSDGTESTFDELGRLTSQKETTQNLLTTTEYLAGNQVKVTNPRGFSTTNKSVGFSSPSDGYLQSITSPEGVTTSFTYNNQYKAKTVSQSGIYGTNILNFTRHLYYDEQLRLCRVTNPEGHNTGYGYDNANRLAWKAFGASSLTTDSCLPPTNNRTIFQYDTLSQLKNVNNPAGTDDISYQYDNVGNVLKIATNNTVWNYDYNSLNQLKQESLNVDEQTFTLKYLFDSLGNTKQVTYPVDNKQIHFDYDALGAVTKITEGINNTLAEQITYHPNGQLKAFIYGNGLSYQQTINAQQLPEDIKVSNNLMEYSYLYDDNGNVQTIEDNLNSTYNRGFSYDGLDRLTLATGQWGTGNYSYDPIGNIRSKEIGNYHLIYNYDVKTNLLTDVQGSHSKSFSYDNRGNVLTNGKNSFIVDQANQVIQLNNQSDNSKVASYLYDGHKRRVKKAQGDNIDYSVYGQGGKLLFKQDSKGTHAYVHLAGQNLAKISELTSIENPIASPVLESESANNYNGNISLNWTSELSGYYYELYNGEILLETTQLDITTATVDMPLGQYNFSVKACNVDSVCSDKSNVVTVNVAVVSAPTMLGSDFTDTDGNITLNWSNISHSTSCKLLKDNNTQLPYKVIEAGIFTENTILEAGVYLFSIQACNLILAVEHCSEPSEAISVTIELLDNPIPEPPVFTGNDRIDYDGNFTLSWDAVTHATTYELNNGTNTAELFTNISNMPSGLYNYTVKACNSSGECSAASESQTITVSVITPPVITPQATPNYDGNFTVAWGAVEGVTDYEFTLNDEIETTTDTSISFNGLSLGSYTFKVRACINDECSKYSTTIINVEPPEPPEFIGPNIIDYDGNITVTWSESIGASYYELFQGATILTPSQNALSKNITLTEGTYIFNVRACSAVGCGNKSNPLNVVIRVPDAPVISGIDFSDYDGNYTITWNDVNHETRYELKKGSDAPTALSANITSESYSNVVEGIYLYQVRACSAVGCSDYSNTRTVSVLRPLPGPVSIIGNNYSTYNSSVSVSWNTDSDASYYKVYKGSSSSVVNSIAKASSQSKTFSSLTAGAHTFKVQACNSIGCAPNSNSITVTVKAPAKPSISGSNYTDYDGSVNISWNNVSHETYYELYKGSTKYQLSANVVSKSFSLPIGSHAFKVRACSTVGCSAFSSIKTVTVAKPSSPSISGFDHTVHGSTVNIAWSNVTGESRFEVFKGASKYDVTANTLSKSFNNLSVGTYSFKVRACSAVGCSGYSNIRTVTVKLPLPGPVSIIGNNYSTYNSSVSVSWNTDSDASYYKVYKGSSSSVVNSIAKASTQSKTFSSLTAGAHTFKVQACNSTGCAANSNSITVTVKVPAKPSISGSNYTDYDGTVSIGWNNVSYETGYELYKGSTKYSLSANTVSKSFSLPVGSHAFKVRACSAVGCSAFSSIKTVTVAKPSTPSISGSNYTDYDGTITLNWNNVAGETSYKLYNNASLIANIGANATSKTLTLSAGAHNFTLKACNALGCSANSNTRRVTVSAPGVTSIGSTTASYRRGLILNTRWSSVSGASTYKLFVNNILVYSGGAVSFSGLLPQIPDGPMFLIEVQACNGSLCGDKASRAVFN